MYLSCMYIESRLLISRPEDYNSQSQKKEKLKNSSSVLNLSTTCKLKYCISFIVHIFGKILNHIKKYKLSLKI